MNKSLVLEWPTFTDVCSSHAWAPLTWCSESNAGTIFILSLEIEENGFYFICRIETKWFVFQ